jgi:hypothetical protein
LKQKRDLYTKEIQKLLQNNSTTMTLMTAEDFGNKQVVSNQLKLTKHREDPGTTAYVPGAQGGMPKIS